MARPRALLLSLAVLLAGCTLQPNVASVTPNGHVGSSAPTLKGTSLAGASLAVDLHKSGVVIVFWAAWCGPCRKEQPGLNKLAAEYATKGVQFYGVDMLDHDRAQARAFVQEFKVAYPSLYDDSGSVAASYEVDAPPSTILVNSKGIIVGRYPGEATEAQVRALIVEKLLT
ncbi:MAG TPA: TlpA disulfide reductase family protein [Candidatus Dormibacteraeota bacterium]